MASTDLELIIKARDEASKTLGRVSKKAGGLGKMMGGALRTGAIAGGVAVAGIGIAAVKMGLDFEKSLAEVRTLLPDLNDEGFAKLQTGVLDLSKELGIATSEAVPALYQAISAGVPPDNVMDFMKTAGKAAIGGVTDLETAVDGISSVVNTYGADAISAGQASDIMFTTVKLGKTTFDELASSLFNVLPTAQSLGISFEEVGAAIATMTAQGVPTSVATTKMRMAMVEASKGGTKLDLALRELRGEGLIGLIESGEDFSHVMQDMRERMPDQEFRDLFGSTEALDAALAITGEQAGAMAANLDEARASAGAGDAAFDTMAETAGFKLNKAINLLKVTLTEVGIKILPMLTKALDKALPFLEKNLPVAIEKGQKAIEDIRPHVEAFAKTFKVGMDVAEKALKPLVKFIVKNKPILILAIAAIGIAILLALGPGAIAIAAIIGFIALLGLVKQNIGGVKDFIVGKFEAIRDAIVGAVQGVINWVTDNWPLILAILLGPLALMILAVITFKDDIIGFFTELKDKVFDVVEGLADDVVGLWETLRDDVVEIATGLKDRVVEVVTEFKNRLVRGFTNIWNKAVEIFEFLRVDVQRKIAKTRDDVVAKILGIPGAIGGVLSLLVQKGKDILIGFATGYVAQWGNVARWFVDLGPKILRTIGSFASRLWFSGWQLLSGLWSGIKARAVRLFNDLASIANEILDTLQNPWKLLSPSKETAEMGDKLMAGLLVGMKAAMPAVLAWLKKTFTASGSGEGRTSGAFIAAAKFGSLGLRMRGMGIGTINSFLSGLKAAWPRVSGWMRDATREFKAQFEASLGIGSPSRLFIAYGEDLMKGLQMGLDDQAAKVDGAVGRITAGIDSASPGGVSAGAGRAAGAVNLTLVIQSKFAPNSTDLASEVRNMLPEIERQLDLQRS